MNHTIEISFKLGRFWFRIRFARRLEKPMVRHSVKPKNKTNIENGQNYVVMSNFVCRFSLNADPLKKRIELEFFQGLAFSKKLETKLLIIKQLCAFSVFFCF